MNQQMRLAYSLIIACIVLLGGLAAFGQANKEEPNVPEITFETDVFYVLSGDQKHWFDLEIANTNEKRSRGLMYRRFMRDDKGMLFIFGTEKQRAFWMRNTYIPLDIIFINERGEIETIARQTNPLDDTPVPSKAPARYVLEINGGLAEKLGISVGDVLCHQTIRVNPECSLNE